MGRRWIGMLLSLVATVLTLPMLVFLLFVAFAPDGGPQPGAPLKVFVLGWAGLLVAFVGAAWWRRRSRRLPLIAVALSGLSWLAVVMLEAIG